MFTCCLIINVGRTGAVVPVTLFIFSLQVWLLLANVVTGELPNMEKGISVSFLNDTHSSFNFTTVFYKLCFNGAGVLINQDCFLWKTLSSPLLVFHIICLLVGDWLVANDDICQQWLLIPSNRRYRFCNKTVTTLHRNVYLCSLSKMFIFHLSEGRP